MANPQAESLSYFKELSRIEATANEFKQQLMPHCQHPDGTLKSFHEIQESCR